MRSLKGTTEEAVIEEIHEVLKHAPNKPGGMNHLKVTICALRMKSGLRRICFRFSGGYCILFHIICVCYIWWRYRKFISNESQ